MAVVEGYLDRNTPGGCAVADARPQSERRSAALSTAFRPARPRDVHSPKRVFQL